jgi:hypothetical protein
VFAVRQTDPLPNSVAQAQSCAVLGVAVAERVARIGCATGRWKFGSVQNKRNAATDLKRAARLSQRKNGGAGRNRTADKGFADLCLTTWRPRPCCKELIRRAEKLPRKRSVQALNQAIVITIPSSRLTISTQIFAPLLKSESSPSPQRRPKLKISSSRAEVITFDAN